MNFWKFIEKNVNNRPNTSSGSLEKKLRAEFPSIEENKLAEITCIAGLLGRVAFVDLNIEESEKKNICEGLKKWLEIDEELAQKITKVTCTEIELLAGTENHQYTGYLKDNLEISKRYKVLEMLFSVAASDGNADNLESEEIRTISKGLGLEHKHFVAARMSVKEYLGSLKNN